MELCEVSSSGSAVERNGTECSTNDTLSNDEIVNHRKSKREIEEFLCSDDISWNDFTIGDLQDHVLTKLEDWCEHAKSVVRLRHLSALRKRGSAFNLVSPGSLSFLLSPFLALPAFS